MDYMICYVDTNDNTVWEGVWGEDAMDVRVSELTDEFECDSDKIVVFDTDSQLELFKEMFNEYCRSEINAGHCGEYDCQWCAVNMAWDRIFCTEEDNED